MGIKSRSAGASPGTSYYVAAAGNDSHDGKSPANAWATIAKVNSATLHAGDSVLFNGGDTFNDATLFINQTNVPSLGDIKNPILVSSYGSRQAILQSGAAALQTYSKGAVVVLDGVSGLSFENLTVNGYNPTITSIARLTTNGAAINGANDGTWSINNAVAPNGSTTATTFFDDGAFSAHDVYINFPYVSNSTYSLSVDIKGTGSRYVSVRGAATESDTSHWPWVTLDTVAGTLTTNGDVTSSSAVANSNGYWTVNMTWLSTSASVSSDFIILASSSSTSTAPATTNNGGNVYTGGAAAQFNFANLLVTQTSNVAAATFWGIVLQNSNTMSGVSVGEVNTVTIKNCNVYGCWATGNDYGAHIFVIGLSLTNNCGTLRNIKILNNNLYGANGLEDNGITGYGCGGGNYGTIQNALYQGNLVHDIPGHNYTVTGNGIILNGANNSLAQFNLVRDCGGNNPGCGGSGGIWPYGGVGADNNVLQFNEVYNQGSDANLIANGCDNYGMSFDVGTTNSIMQYNYVHDNWGPGIDANSGSNFGGNGNHHIRYNIVENNQKGSTRSTGGGILTSATQFPIYIYNNTIYSSHSYSGSSPPSGLSLGFSGTFVSGCLVANNIMYVFGTDQFGRTRYIDGGNGPNISGVTFDHNVYFGAGTPRFVNNNTEVTSLAAWQAFGASFDAHSSITDPMLAAPGTGGTAMPNIPGYTYGPNLRGLNGYKLKVGSPCIGTGLDLTQSPWLLNVGTRDFFGNAIPHGTGTGYNVGAYGGTGV